jgi:hypothetical protein
MAVWRLRLVPELTRSADIKLNEGVSLRRHLRAVSLPHRTLPHVRTYPTQSRQAAYSAWRLCFWLMATQQFIPAALRPSPLDSPPPIHFLKNLITAASFCGVNPISFARERLTQPVRENGMVTVTGRVMMNHCCCSMRRPRSG